MKLVLSRGAARQLGGIIDYIAERNPQGARNVEERIHTAMRLLLEHPLAGSATDEPKVRRMLAKPYPYAIFYRRRGDELIILRIRHTARQSS